MLPARICRIKIGSRIVPILVDHHPCRLAVKARYARCRVEVRILVARIQVDVLRLTSGVPRGHYISARRSPGTEHDTPEDRFTVDGLLRHYSFSGLALGTSATNRPNSASTKGGEGWPPGALIVG
jgi:hypothetical protein